jgi:trimeric autotransporter adhesin
MKSAQSSLSTFFKVSLFCALISVSLLNAQQPASSLSSSTVPRLVNFSGKAADAQGKTITGIAGVTFAIYKDQSEGAALWLETQNVQADTKGNYTVQLGATKPDGLPLDLFSSGEARWLGVTINGGTEQPRSLLLSVPYALKALDAETLGGRPVSAFMIAPTAASSASSASHPAAGVPPPAEQANEIVCASGTACKTNFFPIFSTNGGSAKVTDSIVTQSGTTVKINGSATVTSTASASAILGTSTGTSGTSNGVEGVTSSGTASGVAGVNNGSGWGVYGSTSGTSATSIGVEGVTSSPLAYGVAGSNESSGIGVYGNGGTGVYGTGNSSYGVYGVSNSSHGIVGISNGNFFGVVGEGGGAGVYGSGPTGIQGFATSGYGMYGQSVGASTRGDEVPFAGVWGDTNTLGSAGVAGTGQDGIGGIFLNDSPSGNWALVAANYNSNGPIFTAENQANGVQCNINAFASLQCDGGIGAMVQLDSGNRKVAMSGIESPENWFEDFGSAQLVNGVAVIKFDRDFIQTVNTGKAYRVFTMPNGDCKGLYVTNKTANSFEVRELGNGSSNIRFDYRITAIRRNYETVRFADHTKDRDARQMLDQMRKSKPVSTFNPVSAIPASLPIAGVPAAQSSNR